MSKLIIVCGLPGTGKTTLAKALSKKLGIFCLHKDSLKESLYDSMKMSSLEDSKKLGYPTVKAVLDLAEQNIAHGIDVILESPFNFPDVGKIFRKWKKKYNLSLFSVILHIDEDERRQRFLERERHRSHHDNKRKLDYEEMKFSYDHMPEKKIFLTTNKLVEELVEEVSNQFD
jgi:predicted kinase